MSTVKFFSVSCQMFLRTEDYPFDFDEYNPRKGHEKRGKSTLCQSKPFHPWMMSLNDSPHFPSTPSRSALQSVEPFFACKIYENLRGRELDCLLIEFARKILLRNGNLIAKLYLVHITPTLPRNIEYVFGADWFCTGWLSRSFWELKMCRDELVSSEGIFDEKSIWIQLRLNQFNMCYNSAWLQIYLSNDISSNPVTAQSQPEIFKLGQSWASCYEDLVPRPSLRSSSHRRWFTHVNFHRIFNMRRWTRKLGLDSCYKIILSSKVLIHDAQLWLGRSGWRRRFRETGFVLV